MITSNTERREHQAGRLKFLANLRESDGLVTINESSEDGSILIVDDDPNTLWVLTHALKKLGKKIVCVLSIAMANQATLDSLKAHKPFNLGIFDLNVGTEIGEGLVRRVMDIIPRMNVLIISAEHVRVGLLTFVPDEIMLKDLGRFINHPKYLIEVVNGLLQPRRKNIYSWNLQVNRWRMSIPMGSAIICGVNRITTRPSDKGRDDGEKITSQVQVDGAYFCLNTYVYPKEDDPHAVSIAVQCALGCRHMCPKCRAHKHHIDASGKGVAFVRSFTANEIIVQPYLAMNHSTLLREMLDTKVVTKRVVLYFSGEGEPSDNFDNCAEAIKRLAEIEIPQFYFVITSIGDSEKLAYFLRQGYAKLPRTSHHWSVDSAIPWKRKILQPGSKDDDLDEILARYRAIWHESPGRPGITISITLSKFNATREDAIAFARRYRRFAMLRYKVSKRKKGDLDLADNDVTTAEARNFCRMLREAGVQNEIRLRRIYGNINDGCGQTIGDFEQSCSYQ